jgi:copper chaperone CopZ
MPTAVTATYNVNGMTCRHCVRAVSEELARLPGVMDVAVDLDGGRATVTSAAPLPAGAVAVAVEQAGYEVTS